MPPLAIAEPAIGVQSNTATPLGTAPIAGIAVKSTVETAELFVKLLPARSSENCVAGVAVFAWKTAGVSAKTTFLTWRSDVARSGTATLAPRRNVSGSRSDTPAAGKRERTPLM